MRQSRPFPVFPMLLVLFSALAVLLVAGCGGGETGRPAGAGGQGPPLAAARDRRAGRSAAAADGRPLSAAMP